MKLNADAWTGTQMVQGAVACVLILLVIVALAKSRYRLWALALPLSVFGVAVWMRLQALGGMR